MTSPVPLSPENYDDRGLLEAGFRTDAARMAAVESMATELGLNSGGPYRVLGAYERAGVRVLVEQNTSTTNQGGQLLTITHPAVAVLESAKGRVAAPAGDVQLILRLADELS